VRTVWNVACGLRVFAYCLILALIVIHPTVSPYNLWSGMIGP
jgi:hypothetical protein